MYQTQICIQSVISISLTQKIFNIKLVRGRCQDIAACNYSFYKVLVYVVNRVVAMIQLTTY